MLSVFSLCVVTGCEVSDLLYVPGCKVCKWFVGVLQDFMSVIYLRVCVLGCEVSDLFLSFFLSFIFIFIFLATLRSLRDLSSPTGDRTWAPAVKVPSPNHWTARGFPLICFCVYFPACEVCEHFVAICPSM